MKKQLFSLVALLFCALTTTFAQSPLVATLSHNDTVSVYYGRSAFQSAYNASTHGDVITLSSGSFDVPSSINKNITIRGAGMEKDSVNNVFPTILMGDFSVYNTYSSDTVPSKGIVMEGISCDGAMFCGKRDNTSSFYYNLENSQFIKCRFYRVVGDFFSETYVIGTPFYPSFMLNVVFSQCIVTYYLHLAGGNPIFMNCIIFEPDWNYSTKECGGYLNSEFYNCVLVNPEEELGASVLFNCALWGNVQLSSSNIVYQCVGNYTGTKGGMFDNIIGDLGNISLTDKTALFKTFRGTYSETETFELTDSAKEKYLGTDGTQVGIYGGTLPFSPQVSMPQIKKFKVAPKSTEDGKLSVEIEVSAAE